MSASRVMRSMGVGLLTALILTGSILLAFAAYGQVLGYTTNPRHPFLVKIGIVSLMWFAPFLLGGGLWGLSLGLVLRGDMETLARTGALTWAASAYIGGMVLYWMQIPAALIDQATPLGIHALYTIFFVAAVGLVAGINARAMAAKLGSDAQKTIVGRRTGIVAGLGFLAASLILLFGFGWEVGKPGVSMIRTMETCQFIASLAGGVVMGWMLVQEREPILSHLISA